MEITVTLLYEREEFNRGGVERLALLVLCLFRQAFDPSTLSLLALSIRSGLGFPNIPLIIQRKLVSSIRT